MILLKDIKRVAVGSLNPVKIQAVKDVLAFYLEHEVFVEGLPAPSGVSDMPMSQLETESWAYNRAKWCLEQGGFDMTFGLEWWVYDQENVLWDIVKYISGDVAICDSTWYANIGRGPSFVLPSFMTDALNKGEELWLIMDRHTWVKDTKKKWGAVWYLTWNYLPRKEAFSQIVVQAIVPWLHPTLYTSSWWN